MLNTGGVMLEIEDAGIGMTPEELDDANERLANPPVIDVAISRRMGLYVVGRLATRHGIQVRLRRSAGGGITALVLVPSTLLAGAEGEQHAPTPELSATGARSLGALPRRGGQSGFPEQGEGTGDVSVFPSEGVGAPPYRGSAPLGLGSAPAGLSSAGLSNGDQFADLPPFGGAPARPTAGQDDLPRRAEPLRDGDGPGRGPSPSIPGARTPFEDRSGVPGPGVLPRSGQHLPVPAGRPRPPGTGPRPAGRQRAVPGLRRPPRIGPGVQRAVQRAGPQPPRARRPFAGPRLDGPVPADPGHRAVPPGSRTPRPPARSRG